MANERGRPRRRIDHQRRIVLTAQGAEAVLDPDAGGRIAALRVDGIDLLVTEGEGPLAWGAYPMIPWAGRLREGRLEFRGRVDELPRTMAPHAIHGTTWDRAWTAVEALPDDATLGITLDRPWPYGGRAIHRVELEPRGLRSTLEVHAADRPMPAVVGWHPWFRRRIEDVEVELDLHGSGILLRGPDGLPTDEVVAPGPGPWDDTFVGVESPPVVRWPGIVELEIRAEAPYWVVDTEQPTGICVEPQTGPPNGLATNHFTVVEPGAPLVTSMTLVWRRLG